MGDHVADLPKYPKREAAGSVAKEDMDAQRFAHISDLCANLVGQLCLEAKARGSCLLLTYHIASACVVLCFAAHESLLSL